MNPMTFQFTGEVIFWKGPSPFYFVPVPEAESHEIKAIAPLVTYGWGVIPVQVQIGETVFQTSLFPKGDVYLVPLKVVVRKAEQLDEGDLVDVQLVVG